LIDSQDEVFCEDVQKNHVQRVGKIDVIDVDQRDQRA
jgi:hypothetical protein